ncbi:hypothetical protein [Dactylosporangium sp. NPDC051484]|uniref:hypothetical protein n=1 Tax=Dactylosporangium sp. NPDC051484 TaxID=3154942 RepID=UPI00344FEB75
MTADIADGLPLIREFRDAEEPWRALANGLDGRRTPGWPRRTARATSPPVTLGLGRVAALDGDGDI